MAQKSPDLSQNGLAWLSGLIPEQRHRDGFGFIKTEPWTVNGTALAMLRDFHFNA
jgi:hypothetical protein